MKEDLYVVLLSPICEPSSWAVSRIYKNPQKCVLSMPGPHCFDDLCSATFTMLFNVALFSSLLLVPAVLAVPSALGASVTRRREGRQSQLDSRREQTDSADSIKEYSPLWAGVVLTEDNVRSVGYSAIAIDLIHILFI
jgi:hypothetical protein